jgi:hypothetical protein
LQGAKKDWFTPELTTAITSQKSSALLLQAAARGMQIANTSSLTINQV